tara:strand:- start:3264 stop:3809 length:546 start_codon:yes stop_codon:yes gene_type:complete
MEPLRRGMTEDEWSEMKLDEYLCSKPHTTHNPSTDSQELKAHDFQMWAELKDMLFRQYERMEFRRTSFVYGAPRLHYVMITSSDEQYGGSEEGGWYYWSESFVKWTSCATREEADALVLEYNTLKKNPPFTPCYDQLGGDDTVNSNYPEGYIPRGFTFSKNLSARHTFLPFVEDQETPYYE